VSGLFICSFYWSVIDAAGASRHYPELGHHPELGFYFQADFEPHADDDKPPIDGVNRSLSFLFFCWFLLYLIKNCSLVRIEIFIYWSRLPQQLSHSFIVTLETDA